MITDSLRSLSLNPCALVNESLGGTSNQDRRNNKTRIVQSFDDVNMHQTSRGQDESAIPERVLGRSNGERKAQINKHINKQFGVENTAATGLLKSTDISEIISWIKSEALEAKSFKALELKGTLKIRSKFIANAFVYKMNLPNLEGYSYFMINNILVPVRLRFIPEFFQIVSSKCLGNEGISIYGLLDVDGNNWEEYIRKQALDIASDTSDTSDLLEILSLKYCPISVRVTKFKYNGEFFAYGQEKKAPFTDEEKSGELNACTKQNKTPKDISVSLEGIENVSNSKNNKLDIDPEILKISLYLLVDLPGKKIIADILYIFPEKEYGVACYEDKDKRVKIHFGFKFTDELKNKSEEQLARDYKRIETRINKCRLGLKELYRHIKSFGTGQFKEKEKEKDFNPSAFIESEIVGPKLLP